MLQTGTNPQWDNFRSKYSHSLDSFAKEYIDAKPPLLTHITALDNLTGGLRPGLTVLGGEPGAGKSALALQIAALSSWMNHGAIYFSLEMGYNQCMARVLSYISCLQGFTPFVWSDIHKSAAQSRALLNDAKRNSTEPETIEKLCTGGDVVYTTITQAREGLQKLAIIDNVHEVESIEQITAEAVEIGAEIAIIDYLQLIRLQTINTEYERVTGVSSRLTLLSKKCNIPFLILSSISRDKANIPNMHCFKGSGQIEFDANMALVITTGETGQVQLHVLKNRHGAVTGSNPIILGFDKAHNRMF